MQYLNLEYKDALASISVSDGKCREANVIIRHTSPAAGFSSQLAALQKIAEILPEKLEGNFSPVFMRWFLSDAANQARLISGRQRCATSIIQQSPLDGSKISLWIIYREAGKFNEISPGIWKNEKGEVWMGDIPIPSGDSFNMTTAYLEHLDRTLENYGATLADHCLRTWFMVRDIDVNYKGVVKGRNEIFDRIGLTADTHFIASTGINGVSADPGKTVAFSACADISIKPGQISYLHGHSHLNPTAEYGVAFERGTAIDYPGYRRIFISGTASINNRGEILYPGDVTRQTERMLENIEVLLEEGKAGWEDVTHFIVYIRDIADYAEVAESFSNRFPEVPTVIVLAPVCRPGWLVETECGAIISVGEC